MQTFSIIVLVILFAAVQHLSNWGIRKLHKEDPNNGLIVVIAIVNVILSALIVNSLIVWGNE